MTDCRSLLRPQLLDLGPYVPGPSLDALKREYGLDGVAKLNWNEGLFGPLPGVLEAVARELDETWAYPEHAYLELRERIAAETGAGPGQILPGHGIQMLILTLCSAFLSPGDRVVVPQPTYGLYAQASRAAGAVVELVPSPELRLDLERIAAAARQSGARIVWVCDPNNPTGSRLDPGDWAAFLDALPPGCVAVADEAYMDYVEPATRLRREEDVAGSASLGRPDELAERRRDTAAAREWLAAALPKEGIRAIPSEANFLLVEHGVDDALLIDGLLRRGVLIRSGAEMGMPGWARITVAPQPLMELVAEALPAVRAELSGTTAR
jgi:histidinol-phosphate aminotransferase